MAQSLARQEGLADLVGAYGFVIVDECHHVPAATFERVVRQLPVRHWLGLTATPSPGSPREAHLDALRTGALPNERQGPSRSGG